MHKRNLASWLAVAGLGMIGTAQYHWAQFSSRFDTFFGDRGDARGFAYYCEHWYQSFRGRTNLLSPGVFYPTKATLAYSDLLLGYAIPYSFFRGLGVGIFSSVEIVVIVFTFLSYVTCLVLLYKVLRFGLPASCAGAMFFAFSSPKFFQTGHLQLQFVWLLPLIFVFVISFSRQAGSVSQKRAAVFLSLAGLLLDLQLVTAFYYAWFFVVWSIFFLAFAIIFRRSRWFLFSALRNYWTALLISAVIFLLGFLPFMLVYLPTVRVGTWYSYSNVSQMIPEWWSFLSMGDGNYLWGWLSALVKPDPPPATWGELMVGVGVVSTLAWIAITVYAIYLARKYSGSADNRISGENPSTGRVFLAVMILTTTLFYLLGAKYWGGHSPWYLVYGVFPGAGAIRAMARYVIFLTLPMAIAFAYVLDAGLQWSAKQKTRRSRIALTAGIYLVAAFGVAEQFGVFKVGGTGFSKRTEERYLKATAGLLPADCKAFYIAAGPRGKHNPFEYQYDAMLISILRGIPTLNGSSSQFPPQWSLYLVKDPEYETNVRKWIDLHHLAGVCRLEVGPQVEDFAPHGPNPIDDPNFFVSQQYGDFLGREPQGDEGRNLADQIKSCPPRDALCTRAAISLGLFHSTGLYEKGAFIFRLYEVGLGRMPRFDEFNSDLRKLGGNPDPKSLDTDKNNLVEQFVQTPEFLGRFQDVPDSQYAAMILKTANLNSSPQLARELAGETKRAQILRKIADSAPASGKFKNAAFVALHYFAYLRRDPENLGYEQWLDELNKTGDFEHVTSGFVNSSEYRERFGAPFSP